MSEPYTVFVERIKREWDGDNVPCVEDFDQLIALARRGAAIENHGQNAKLSEELKRLRVENIQMQAALGYAICAEDERHIIPSNPYKCGICDANKGVHDEIARLRAALRNAVMSDTEYCAEIERINKALIEATTVDVDVVVPDRDYSAMTPKDCYEAGLLDGVYQAREAIKAATRAALEERT